MSYFAVFECSRTLELQEEAAAQGLPAWVPVVFEKRDGDLIKRPAFSGYIFVRYSAISDFRRWCPERYSPSLMTEFYGRAGLPRHQFVRNVRPARVPEVQLIRLAEHLKDLYEGLISGRIKETGPHFNIGDRVEVIFGLFRGVNPTGEVVRMRADGRARVRLDGGRYLEAHKTLLKKI